MSHELRTPLNAIIGFSEIMESGMFGTLGSEKYQEYCHDILTSGHYLLEVINDILDMSKIEAGRMKLDLEPLDLSKTLAESLRVVSGRAEDKRLVVDPISRAPLPWWPIAAPSSRSSSSCLQCGEIHPRWRQGGGAHPLAQRSDRADDCRHRHRDRPQSLAGSAAIRAGREPAHQNLSRLRAWAGDRASR